MSEVLGLFESVTMGLAVGAIFFGGLWWQVGRAMSSKQPAL